MGGGHLQGLIQIRTLDQGEPADHLFGVGERSVGEQDLVTTHPDGGGVTGRLQPLDAHQRPRRSSSSAQAWQSATNEPSASIAWCASSAPQISSRYRMVPPKPSCPC
jgi:hypothetical protein